MRLVSVSILALSLVLGAAACQKQAPVPAGQPAVAEQPQAAAPQQVVVVAPPGTQVVPAQYANAPTGGETARATSSCPLNQKVESGDLSQPGGPIYLAYQAALKGDTPESFNVFYSQFVEGKNVDEIKRNIWSRVLQHVNKYTASAEDPSFVLCKSQVYGENQIKVFVKCNDPRKSDPPIILQKVGDTYKIDTLTP